MRVDTFKLRHEYYMEEFSIKIRIYDRQYPMKVHPKDEAVVRDAAEVINSMLQGYRENYKQVDIQDLLSMVALDTVIEKLKLQQQSNEANAAITSEVTSLLQLLDDVDEA